MTSAEVRKMFLDFFVEKGSTIMPSSSLVPENDPTLLLTSAGMVQMKPFFMGEAVPPNVRLTTAQKCFRTSDIEGVGNERSLTFFEMMGNFSVGDYFKKEAIAFAWELATQRFKFPAEKIWVTVHPTDDEAAQLWRDIVGMPAERIVRLEENWWGPAGETGPCGPDSELYIDRGPEKGCGKPDCMPGCDCERYLEFWNLVFMQFYQDKDGTRTPLPRKNIDTGLGLERSTMLIQGKTSVYETDLFMPIIECAAALANTSYGKSVKTDFSLRVIADHSRAVAFLIGDGVLPSNEGRGYILRRILRRAVRHGRLLGLTKPFITKPVQVVVDLMSSQYPELSARKETILKVAAQEEAKFGRALAVGMNVLDDIIREARAADHSVLSGESVFKLYDTFGFPKELTAEMVAEQGLSIDWEGFDAAMESQRERARASHKFGLGDQQSAELYRMLGDISTDFVGYDTLRAESEILAIIGSDSLLQSASAPREVEIVLKSTPFYAESGGQVGDMGTITGPTGRARVLDTQKLASGVTVQQCVIEEGTLEVGDEIAGLVDEQRRLATARHHTATHLLHRALREVLGAHVQQSGSLVGPERLRFDFTHTSSIDAAEMRRVQQLVNGYIRENLPVSTRITTYSDALKDGAMALFGEKYGSEVRLVDVESCSQELCGGTHVARTGQIGCLFVVSEGSIGSGLRRVEAVGGAAAIEHALDQTARLDDIAEALQSQDPLARVKHLQAELATQKKALGEHEKAQALNQVSQLVASAKRIGDVNVLAAEVTAASPDRLRDMADVLRTQLQPSVVVLAAVFEGKPSVVAMVSPGLVVHAGKLVKEVASIVGGGGGGRPDLAQAGGKDASKLPEALAAVYPAVEKALSGK